MAKKKEGVCVKCGKPVYAYTGKDIPEHTRMFAGEVANYINQQDGTKIHHSCAGHKSAFGLPDDAEG